MGTDLVKRVGKLRLRVNESKRTVARVVERPFLSFGLWVDKEERTKIIVADMGVNQPSLQLLACTNNSCAMDC